MRSCSQKFVFRSCQIDSEHTRLMSESVKSRKQASASQKQKSQEQMMMSRKLVRHEMSINSRKTTKAGKDCNCISKNLCSILIKMLCKQKVEKKV